MDMILYDFVNMALDNYYDCYVWDNEKEENVFDGTIDDIPSNLLSMPFTSWEIEGGKIGLNIN